jgi:Na+/pantothenate symporter
MVQMILVLMPLLAVTIYFFTNNELVTHVNYTNINYQEFGVSKSVLFGFFGFCFVIGSLEIWQRYARINTNSDSLRLVCVSTVGLAIAAIGIYVISAIVHINFLGDLDPNTVFSKIFSGTTLPDFLSIALTIAILSAILSTADTFIQGSATLIVKAIQGNEISSQKGVRLYKIILSVLGVILILVSNIYSNILSMAIVFANLVFAFTPLLLLLIFGLRPDYRLVNIGLLSSCIFAIVVGISPDLGLEYSYGTLMISMVFMALGLVVGERKAKEEYVEN